MGGRKLRQWLGQPLMDVAALNRRLDAVAWFVASSLARSQVISVLSRVSDLERLINRVRSGIAIPREVVTLRKSLESRAGTRESIEKAAAPDP
jgi:DNA mismatch repair protein MutS